MKLIPLLLIITSCANVPHFETNKRFIVTKQYSCPSGYKMAHDIDNRLFCVLSDFNQNTIEFKQIKKKPLKTAKKPLKIDCQRVFRDINSCMK